MKQNRFTSIVALVLSMMMVSTVAFGVLVAALFTTSPTYAAPPIILESEDNLPIVAFEGNELKKFGFNDNPQIIDTNTNPLISNHVWSPDGNWLAYLRIGENGSELMLADVSGRTLLVIARDVNSGMPFHFSDDNTQLFYAIVPDPEQATSINDQYTVDVMSIFVGSSNAPTKLGSFKQVSCGGTGPLIYDMLFWAEAGTKGMRPILAVTSYGIIYSTTCEGKGVAILDTRTGIDVTYDKDITNVTLSPDKKMLLGIKNGQIIVVDVETGQILMFTVEATPDQVIWGASGTNNIYYSVRTATDETVSYTTNEQQQILNATGLQVSNVNETNVEIHRFNLETSNDEIVYNNTAYAIGHMTLLPDNRVLMISEVPSLSDWFASVLNSDNSKTPQLQTSLYLVSLEGADTRLIGTGLTGARLNDDEYVRKYGIRPQLSAQPISVNIGTQIQLTGTDFPPQSRVLVYLGADANNMDAAPYAAGFSNPLGEITLSFNLPANRENGQAIGNGQLLLVAESTDGLFSAQTQITVNTNTPATPQLVIIPSLPRPNNPSVPQPNLPANVSISPDNGTVGTQININGRNFPANTRVNIHLGSITNLTGNAVYASAFSDNRGNVSLNFNMPGVYANGTVIQASQVLIVAATDDFSSSSALFFNFRPISQPIVVPSISLNPTNVKVRNAITITGTNFLPNKMVNLLMGPNVNDLRGNYRTVTTDGNGNFVTSFTMSDHWRNGEKIKSKQVVIVGAPHPSGTWSSPVTLEIEERKKNNNKPTQEPTQEVPTEEPTQEPTQEVPIEEPTQEVPIEEPTQEVPIEEPTQEVPTEEPTQEVPTEEPTQEVPTEEPTQEVPTEEPTQEPIDDEPIIQDPAPQPLLQEPVVQVSPNVVGSGGSITVSGNHFPANAVISVRLVSDTIATALGVVNANGDGLFTAQFVVPIQIEDMQTLQAGTYKLVAETADSNAKTTLTISE